MPRAKAGNGIEDPRQIRALLLLTPRQVGLLLGHRESTVLRWIREGQLQAFTALDTSNLLVHCSEVEAFLERQRAQEAERRERLKQRRRH